MSFSIDRYKTNDLSLLRLQDKATGAMVAILPAYGGLLHAFEIPLAGKAFNVIDNYASKEAADKELTTSYKSAHLSPFVCRIANGSYRYEGKEYSFASKFMDGSAIHGLLANKPFQVVSEQAGEGSAAVTLAYAYKAEDAGYPFLYQCETTYTLRPNRLLLVQTILRNMDHCTIPIADGWHPYFTLDDAIDDYTLQFNSREILEFDKRLIPTGRILPDTRFLEARQLRQIQLDNCFPLQLQEAAPCCILRNPRNGLTLSIFTGAQYPYLQVYTPGHRKSIAIENLSGAPDCFNNRMGLTLLQPQHSVSFNVSYQLSVE